jgi:hypothetical protein
MFSIVMKFPILTEMREGKDKQRISKPFRNDVFV